MEKALRTIERERSAIIAVGLVDVSGVHFKSTVSEGVKKARERLSSEQLFGL